MKQHLAGQKATPSSFLRVSSIRKDTIKQAATHFICIRTMYKALSGCFKNQAVHTVIIFYFSGLFLMSTLMPHKRNLVPSIMVSYVQTTKGMYMVFVKTIIK